VLLSTSSKIDRSMKTITPIFLFSLPRSGSTLLQRMIASHTDVATVSETWLLLPLFYLTKTETGCSEYGARLATIGIQEVFDKLEGGESEYRKEIANLTHRIYSKLSRNKEKYFLDKTPRYHLIADEIIEAFPNAKFIFLWRNPLAVVSSIITIWGNNRWNLYRFHIDLYKGIQNLIKTYDKHKTRAIGLQYEALLQDPELEIGKILDYLELSSDELEIEKFVDIRLTGPLGDKSGTREYRDISRVPLEKWKKQLNNPIRKMWCRRYLKWIGSTRLNSIGYDMDLLQGELSRTRNSFKYVLSDLIRMIYGYFFRILDIPILRSRLGMLRRRKRIYPFS